MSDLPVLHSGETIRNVTMLIMRNIARHFLFSDIDIISSSSSSKDTRKQYYPEGKCRVKHSAGKYARVNRIS